MHIAGCYLDFRILFPPCSNRKFHIFRFTIRVSFRTELGSIEIHHVLKGSGCNNLKLVNGIDVETLQTSVSMGKLEDMMYYRI